MDGDSFMLGLAIGALAVMIFSVLSARAYGRILVSKGTSAYRTAEKLPDGKFYYIVPEREYNELDRLRLRMNFQDDVGVHPL